MKHVYLISVAISLDRFKYSGGGLLRCSAPVNVVLYFKKRPTSQSRDMEHGRSKAFSQQNDLSQRNIQSITTKT